MKTNIKQFFAGVIALVAAMVSSSSAWAEGSPVSYRVPVYNIDGDAASGIKEWKTESCTDYTIVTDTTSSFNGGKWYVVNSDVSRTNTINVSGSAHLILCDGASLTVKSEYNYGYDAGITLKSGNSLTVYGQDLDSGKFIVTGPDYSAGIGGVFRGSQKDYDCGTLTINGGTVTAIGGASAAGIGGSCSGNGGTVTINGGTVTATGSASGSVKNTDGAGIGGGQGGDGGTVIINGGTVTATGIVFGTGIGGASSGLNSGNGGTVIINDGTVTAIGGASAAGIGGGPFGNGGTVTINGGTVTANGGTGAGIGCGQGNGGTVTINGGTVTANGGTESAGIGCGSGNGATVTINGGMVTATGGAKNKYGVGAGIGCGPKGSSQGSLIIADTMSVMAGKSSDPATEKDRGEDGSITLGGERYYVVEPRSVRVFQIGKTKYDTISEVLDAAQTGDKITIRKNVDITEKIVVDKSLTIDMNGRKITTGDNLLFKITNGDFVLTGKGNIISNRDNDGAGAIQLGYVPGNTMTCLIDSNVTIESENTIGVVVYGDGNDDSATLTVKGTIKSTKCYAISGNGAIEGSYNYSGTKIVVDGGTITSEDTVAIYHPQKGTLTVNDGSTITGATGIQMCAGTLAVNGGTIIGNGTDSRDTKGEADGGIIDGAAISIVNRSYPGGTPAATITGGTVSSVLAYDWASGAASAWSEETAAAEITGGTFSSDVDEYCAEGYIARKVEDTWTVGEGTWVAQIGDEKYDSASAAIEAAKDGNTITILSDIELADDLTCDAAVTIDLHGNSITISEGKTFTANSDLTIVNKVDGVNSEDSSEGGLVVEGTIQANGKLNLRYLAYGAGGLIAHQGGSLNIGEEGEVDFMSAWDGNSANQLNAQTPGFFGTLDEGAKVVTDKIYTWNGKSFDVNGAIAQAEVTVGDYTYIESFTTIADAIAAIKDGDTITLIKDITTGGTKIAKNTYTDGLTIDLNGKTLSLECPGTGSAGTMTCGFQILKGNKVTFKNGTINCTDANKSKTWVKTDTSKGIAMLIQNYGDLTLEDVNLDGSNIAHNGGTTALWVLSNNSGNIALTGSTSITAAAGDNAFDTCKFQSYALPTVTVNTTGTITGNIELSGGNLTFEAGTLVGTFVATLVGDGTIAISGGTFSSDVDEYCAEGYIAQKTGENEWKVVKGVTLSNVGIENVSVTVTVAGYEIAAQNDGSYLVPSNETVTVTYTATDDSMFSPGSAELSVTLNADKIGGGYEMTDEDKASITSRIVSRWVDGAEGRVIAIDTRERIIITSPEEVLPIAYSTNNWGQVLNGVSVDLIHEGPSISSPTICFFEDCTKNGYYEWTPAVDDYGRHYLRVSAFNKNGSGNRLTTSIYFSEPHPLTWSQVEHGTIAITNNSEALSSPANIPECSLLTLAATPEERYEFAGWTITTNDVAWTNIEDAVTTIEMPNAATVIAGSFQWKSNYTDSVNVLAGETWEILAGETYEAGINAASGSTVTFRESVSGVNALNLAAGATNVWDFTENGSPCFGDFSKITANPSAVEMISFDETLTNGTYLIAANAIGAINQTFLLSDGSSAEEATVVSEDDIDDSDWMYLGAKRFKLSVNNAGALYLIVEDGIPMALEFKQPQNGTIAASTNGAAIVTGEKVYPSLTVGLKFTPADDKWQADTNTLCLVDAQENVYYATNGVFFTEVSLDGASFKMTETSATVSMSYMISDDYRAQLILATTIAYMVTTNEIGQLRNNRLTDAETDAVLQSAEAAFNTALASLAEAMTPAEGEAAADTLGTALEKIAEDAEAASDAKPYEFVIADDFSANPPFENWNAEEGTFEWNGQVWTNGVNAFTSFTGAFTNDTYGAFATNLHVFGSQTIASEPPMVAKWSLDLVSYETEPGVTNTPAVTVEKDLDTGDLINITNTLECIAGTGTIVLGKTADEVDPSIYDDFIADGAAITVTNAGTEPKKEGSNVEIKVDDTAKVETEEGETVIVLPGTENTEGDIKIDVTSDNAATNDVVITGKTEAPNGKVTIDNATLNTVFVKGDVNATEVVINNTGKKDDAEGAIVTEKSIAAKNDVTINNKAHLEANVSAGAKLTINNGSLTTLVGTYDGAEIVLNGDAAGAISNVTFNSEGKVTMTGENVLTGPFAINAVGTIENYGTLTWSVANDNQMSHLADFDVIKQKTGASFKIYIDGEQATSAGIGTYTIAGNAASASGKTFAIVGPDGFKTSIVAAKSVNTIYVGAKAFTLMVNTNNELVFNVAWGKFEISYNALGGKFANGMTVTNIDAYVNKGYEFPAAPVREGYTLAGWYRSWTNGAEKVTELDIAASPVLPLEDHLLYAQWTANSTASDLVLAEFKDGKPRYEITTNEFQKSEITSLITPLYVKNIRYRAFANCNKLAKVRLTQPRDYTTLDEVPLTVETYAFSGSAIRDLVIPAGAVIEDYAFAACQYVTNITFLGKCTIKGNYPFRQCGVKNDAKDHVVTVSLAPEAYVDEDFKDQLATVITNLKFVKISSEVAGFVKYTFFDPDNMVVEFETNLAASQALVSALVKESLADPAWLVIYPLSVEKIGENKYRAIFEKQEGWNGCNIMLSVID